eukprot:gnl/MRDRNA2_/MRDRNA2_55283_c0_seq1.p1 gnl/MRDRNA2_/MRDRNA2_55283_c0~~gnl/MRDRNA2_/MRDRNA2_55283_c0_seq1.p1  ORF type:complete len:228 (-),score=72.17 gnl/MRDRNA2_/MRDRNA2_55283_c0_seq1:240-923(-)
MFRGFSGVLILAILNSGDALNLQKASETGLPSFCIFGMCISDKKEYDSSVKEHDSRDTTIEELTKKQEELDAWKKEELERKQLEDEEKRAKMQEEKDSVVAQSCQCTWQCGDRNDGTVCFRKCCNNEFGGSPNGFNDPFKPIVGNYGATPPAVAASAVPATPSMPAMPAMPFSNPFAMGAPVMPAMPAMPAAPAGAPAAAATNPFGGANPFGSMTNPFFKPPAAPAR